MYGISVIPRPITGPLENMLLVDHCKYGLTVEQ